jgi:uncharacterized membrane protein YhaH (DUF805 family)
MSASSPQSSAPRMARAPFAVAVIAVYLLSFASQMLLSPPVTGRLSVVPFVIVQAVLIAAWIVLHQRRLRDAGRPSGTTIGIAAVYALEIVLFTALVWLLLPTSTASNDGAGSEATILQLFVVLYFLALLTGDPTLGVLQYWLIGFAVLMVLPVAIAVIFSVWSGTRPSLASPTAS